MDASPAALKAEQQREAQNATRTKVQATASVKRCSGSAATCLPSATLRKATLTQMLINVLGDFGQVASTSTIYKWTLVANPCFNDLLRGCISALGRNRINEWAASTNKFLNIL